MPEVAAGSQCYVELVCILVRMNGGLIKDLILNDDASFVFVGSKHVRGTWKRRSLGSVEWMLRTPGSLGLTISEVDLTSTDVPVIALSDQRYFVCDLSDISWYDQSFVSANDPLLHLLPC